jgi:hypothetical protein
MSDEPTVASLDDIYHDLEGSDRARDRLAAFFAREPDAVRGWGRTRTTRSPTQDAATLGVGQSLIARCPADTRLRYQTLLYFEENARHQEDYSILIAAACQIVEAELDRLVTVPAAAIAADLVSALRKLAKDRKQAEILESWAAKEVHTTIGLQITVLLALRRGCEEHMRPVTEFLAEHFQPRYVELLTSKKLAACLDTVRDKFRNPACHGTRTFDEQGYEAFVRLVLARQRFAAWDALGPDPAEPGPEVGVFHHHLSLSRRPAAPADAEEVAPPAPAAADLAGPGQGAAEVFISYASQDRERVLPIADRLEQAGVSLWLDRDQIPGGTNHGPEIVRGIRGCKVLMLMCSDAALRSRNVKQEIQLAWKYGRPYLPLLLEPTSFPEQLEYWLEGWQCVVVHGRPPEGWLPAVLQALARAGVRYTGGEPAPPAAAPAVHPARPGQGLAGLRAVARLTDQIWPVPFGGTGGATRF